MCNQQEQMQAAAENSSFLLLKIETGKHLINWGHQYRREDPDFQFICWLCYSSSLFSSLLIESMMLKFSFLQGIYVGKRVNVERRVYGF